MVITNCSWRMKLSIFVARCSEHMFDGILHQKTELTRFFTDWHMFDGIFYAEDIQPVVVSIAARTCSTRSSAWQSFKSKPDPLSFSVAAGTCLAASSTPPRLHSHIVPLRTISRDEKAPEILLRRENGPFAISDCSEHMFDGSFYFRVALLHNFHNHPTR